jgi:CheY-like chemotaxis protein
VIDNGCGMSEAVRLRVFEPFYTTKREHGTGLGLAIAVDMVRRHRGDITCSSSAGEGSRFDVRIPFDTGLNLPEPTRESVPAPVPYRRCRVLLIDDERAVALVYGELLSMHHEVALANGGKQACEILARDARYDVIVCDLMMPEMDGVALFDYVRNAYPKLAGRFVFCSGGLVTARARELASRPSTRLLYKPVSLDDLLKSIDGVISTGELNA